MIVLVYIANINCGERVGFGVRAGPGLGFKLALGHAVGLTVGVEGKKKMK